MATTLKIPSVELASNGDSKLIVCEVNRRNRWVDNKPTDELLGTVYTLVLPKRRYLKMGVLHEGCAPMITQEKLDEAINTCRPIKATFSGFEAEIYTDRSSNIAIKGRCSGITFHQNDPDDDDLLDIKD